MLRNKKGVTLMVLAITIIVMLIMFSITITTADDLIRSSKETNYKTNLYLIKARAKTLLDDYLFDGTDNLGDETSESSIAEFGWMINEEKYIYRKWNIETLKKQGIDTKNIDSDDVFYIQYDISNEEVDVASANGIVDKEGNYKYTLSSFED